MSLSATIHASAVLVGEAGILIRGASGSGKSTLVLELLSIDPGGTHLVADDRVVLSAMHGRLVADAPPALAGLLEIRGLGIVKRLYVAPVLIRLIVDLVAPTDCPRLPADADATVVIDGVCLPRLFLPVGETHGCDRIRAALGGFPAA
jgi:HPr kinase/phosphorylase